jgi:plastocyanin
MIAGHEFITGSQTDHTMKKMMVMFSLAVLLVLVCGCTRSEPAPAAAIPVPAAPPTRVETPSPAPATAVQTPISQISVSDNTVHIKKSAFDPANISVSVGSTVRWVNVDSTSDPALYNPMHRIALVTIKNSPLLSPGQSWSWIFDQPGSYNYEDMIHPALKGTVTVA